MTPYHAYFNDGICAIENNSHNHVLVGVSDDENNKDPF